MKIFDQYGSIGKIIFLQMVLFEITLIIVFILSLLNLHKLMAIISILLFIQALLIIITFLFMAWKDKKHPYSNENKKRKQMTESDQEENTRYGWGFSIIGGVTTFAITIGGLFILMETIWKDSYPSNNLMIQGVFSLITIVILVFSSIVHYFIIYILHEVIMMNKNIW